MRTGVELRRVRERARAVCPQRRIDEITSRTISLMLLLTAEPGGGSYQGGHRLNLLRGTGVLKYDQPKTGASLRIRSGHIYAYLATQLKASKEEVY